MRHKQLALSTNIKMWALIINCHLFSWMIFLVVQTSSSISVFPLPCLHGCLCYYSLYHGANTMDCSHNNMVQLPQELLPRTQQLIMTGNKLEVLDNIQKKLANIIHFDFENNNIRHISDSVLETLFLNTDSLNLKGNALTQVSHFWQTPSKTTIWLSNNPFECNCDMMWMRDWLLNVTNVRDRKNITCGPGHWKGKLWGWQPTFVANGAQIWRVDLLSFQPLCLLEI